MNIFNIILKLLLELLGKKTKKRQPKISLLIPFSSKDKARKASFKWLLEYWKHELPDAEIIVGKSNTKVFCKAQALNNAFKKSTGQILVVLDSDAYISGDVINRCADRIIEEANSDHPLWYVPYRHLYRLTKEASQLVLNSDTENPYRFPEHPSHDFYENTGDVSKYGHRYGAMCTIMPREAIEVLGCFDERFDKGWGCVDEDTEILTKDGWKKYTQLSIGEFVLTLNHTTGISEWEVVNKVNIYEEGIKKMILFENNTHSSFTTIDHRWPIIDRYGERKWKTSSNINTNHDRVPVCASNINIPSTITYSDALVECIAWQYTEGSIINGCEIAQRSTVHPENCKRIENCLIELFGEEVESFKNIDSSTWKKYINGVDNYYILNASAKKYLLQYAPNKVPSYEFLLHLTKEQLQLFIEVSVLGDGSKSISKNKKRKTKISFEQKDERKAEVFAFACILLGKRVSIKKRKNKAKGDRSSGVPKELDYCMTVVNILDRNKTTVQKETTNGREITKGKEIDYEGVVWCPTTNNGTWLARRKGSIYFTGNSEDICLLRALDTLYGKHKTTNNSIFHLWHPFYGKDYKTRKWAKQEVAGGNNSLANKYHKATGKPSEMRKLVDDGCNNNE